MLFPVFHVGHWLLAQLVPKEVQLCVGQVVFLAPTSLEILFKGDLMDRGHTASVPFGEDAKEAVDNAGCPPVDGIFELEK